VRPSSSTALSCVGTGRALQRPGRGRRSGRRAAQCWTCRCRTRPPAPASSRPARAGPRCMPHLVCWLSSLGVPCLPATGDRMQSCNQTCNIMQACKRSLCSGGGARQRSCACQSISSSNAPHTTGVLERLVASCSRRELTEPKALDDTLISTSAQDDGCHARRCLMGRSTGVVCYLDAQQGKRIPERGATFAHQIQEPARVSTTQESLGEERAWAAPAASHSVHARQCAWGRPRLNSTRGLLGQQVAICRAHYHSLFFLG